MCEREGRGGENCPYQMHCPKRCVTCGDDGNAVCINPMPITDGENTKVQGGKKDDGIHD